MPDIFFFTYVYTLLYDITKNNDIVLFSKTKPKVGLLMIPKTCAYMWIIAMGLQLLF